ncbi:PDR/VanB family oxidoreductase [Nonomuraea basaltis]|uniref:PDR/VanB family oxidoreductase n=1 Tax=Nonomuraea basaltis TaxID=2495887 RepID=UPI00110C402F|nr:PDR/VanB family oxidoreductase [Nonomuraea basaltis]TMR94148.1 oxidoreductase [Nonomuraea basaltis]
MSVRLLMAARLQADAWPAPGVRELTLVPLHREAFPPFVAGDHVQIQHRNGTRRDYSLIGPVSDSSAYRIAIRRDGDGRGGSVLFHDDLAIGDMLFVSYPQPGMRIDPAASHHVFVAGGIGITAILGLLGGLPPGASSEIRYCVRRREHAAYLDVLQGTGADVVVHESSTGDRLDPHKLAAELTGDTTLYYCGPEGLMAEMAQATTHLEPERVRCESFTARASAAGDELGNAFDTWLVLSRRAIHVGADESLVQAMVREGLPVDYSCEGGACGTCVLDVVDGDIQHRDLCLTDDERARSMAACVSRGKGAISVLA